MGDQMEPEEFKSYQAAFDAFDWGHNGKIKYSSLQVFKFISYIYVYPILFILIYCIHINLLYLKKLF